MLTRPRNSQGSALWRKGAAGRSRQNLCPGCTFWNPGNAEVQSWVVAIFRGLQLSGFQPFDPTFEAKNKALRMGGTRGPGLGRVQWVPKCIEDPGHHLWGVYATNMFFRVFPARAHRPRGHLQSTKQYVSLLSHWPPLRPEHRGEARHLRHPPRMSPPNASRLATGHCHAP